MGNVCVNTFSTFNKNTYLRSVYAMDRYEKRRLLLVAKIDEIGRGGIAKVAKQCDIDATYLSRLLYPEGKAGKKRIGEDIKEKLEKGIGNIFQEKRYANEEILQLPDFQKAEKNGLIIEQYDAHGAMGNGLVLRDQSGVINEWQVSDEWLRLNIKNASSYQNLKIVTGFGDSMKGMFNSGDPLIIDIGIKTVEFDSVYFFRVGNEGFIKRLQRIPSVGLRAISENKAYESWNITQDMDFEVFGRVLKLWQGVDF